jgi:hypothetical protein
MAQLNSRGTLTRSRWDYFEHSNGVASVFGSVSSGSIGAYFVNNSTGSTALDLYTLQWTASVAGLWAITLLLPPLVLSEFPASENHIFAVASDTPTPPGLNGMFTLITSTILTYVRYSNTINAGTLAPISGNYFATLPPGWAISVNGPGSSNPCELSMTVWYQYVTDNISPAR